jgi:hypothetical protein
MSYTKTVNRTIKIQVINSPAPACGAVCVFTRTTKHLCPFISVEGKKGLSFKCTDTLTSLTIGNVNPDTEDNLIYPSEQCIVFNDEVVKNFTVLFSNGNRLKGMYSYKELNERIKSLSNTDPFYDDLIVKHTDIHSLKHMNEVIKENDMIIIDYGFDGTANPNVFAFDEKTNSWTYPELI